jgi:hypothetical protein
VQIYKELKMNEDTNTLIEESINLELNLSDLYLLFYELFPDDGEVWGRLTLEEKDHASIIQEGTEQLKQDGIFPTKLFHTNLQTLKDINIELLSLLKKCKRTPPSREEAFKIALKLESSPGELEFQQFMNAETNSKTNNMFKRLNKLNKEHETLIRSYIEKHGISVSR